MKVMLHSFLTVVVAFIFANKLNATTYTATSNGNWSTMVWTPTGTPGAADDVVIPNGDSVVINTNFNINNLTIGGGTSGSLQFDSTLTSASVIVNGNILVQAGARFRAQATKQSSSGLANTLELKGNLTHNGSTLDFRIGTAGSTLSVVNLILSGTTNSTLTVNGAYSATNGDFNAITINKTGGAKVILGSNIIMNGGSSTGSSSCYTILTFISGIIETGSYIWIFQNSTSTNVTGYSSASYINGAMGRGMSNTAGSTKDFPVGDANGFGIFTLRSTTSGSATGHYAIVRCIPGNANTGSSTFTNGIDKVSQVRYYQVSYNQLLGSGATSMSFDRFWPTYTYDDGVSQGNTNLRVAYSINTRATWNGMNQITNPHTTKFSIDSPTSIKPDSLSSPVILTSGSNSIYLALARVSGTTENTLQTSIVLHPTVFIQGLTNGGGTAMTNAVNPITVTVELRNSTSPYALVESQTSTLSNLGVGYFTFSTAVNGTPYYIAIKSANTIETWSKTAQSFDSSYLTYNFTSAATQAFGDNQIQIGSTWCIYSGDVNQDGLTDSGDLLLIDNDYTNYLYGPGLVTDVNGDGVVDSGDLLITDNNYTNYIYSAKPAGAPGAKHITRTLRVKSQDKTGK